jgi:hypothetical protein
MKIGNPQIAVRLIVMQPAQTPPIVADGLFDQRTGSDLRSWRFPVGPCMQHFGLSPLDRPQNRPPGGVSGK